MVPAHDLEGFEEYGLRLGCYRYDRRLCSRLVDADAHFAVLALWFDGRGIIRATATGNDPEVEDTHFGVNETGLFGDADDHHIELVIQGITARRQSLLQRELTSAELAEFPFEDVIEARRVPGE